MSSINNLQSGGKEGAGRHRPASRMAQASATRAHEFLKAGTSALYVENQAPDINGRNKGNI